MANNNNPKRALYPAKGKRIRAIYHNVLFIDPGLTGTGFAFFPTVITSRAKGTVFDAREEGLYTGVWRPTGSKLWGGKTADACAWLNGLVGGIKPNLVVIEYPELWTGSAKSIASASTGKLFKLTYLVGGYGEVVRRLPCTRLPILVTPTEWKGQLPKEVVINRINQKIKNLEKIRDHEGDALGMGLHLPPRKIIRAPVAV